ncbi:hypothetical protein BGZ49_004594, partial [Haplosporangium sp. Z 27]
IPPWDSLIPSAVSYTLRDKDQLKNEAVHPREFSRPYRFFILQVPDVLIIDGDYKNVLVQFRNHDCSTYKRGMHVEYVRLVKEDDPHSWHSPTAEDYRYAY